MLPSGEPAFSTETAALCVDKAKRRVECHGCFEIWPKFNYLLDYLLTPFTAIKRPLLLGQLKLTFHQPEQACPDIH